MSNQLSPGEKVVVTVFVAVLAAATGGMVFFGNAILGVTEDLGELKTAFVEFRVEISGRLDQVDARLDRVDARLDRVEARLDRVDARLDQMEERFTRLETLFEAHSGGEARPAN